MRRTLVNPGCTFTTRKRNVGDVPIFRVYDEAGNELDNCHGTPWAAPAPGTVAT
jgi:hypothetical protein